MCYTFFMLFERFKILIALCAFVLCPFFSTGIAASCFVPVRELSVSAPQMCTQHEFHAGIVHNEQSGIVLFSFFILLVVGSALISLFNPPETIGRNIYVMRQRVLLWIWKVPWPFSQMFKFYVPRYFARFPM